MIRLLTALVLLCCSLFAQTKFLSDSIPAARMQQYADLAVQLDREYLQIDTTNPPGNEARAAAFFKKVLDREGIENQVFEFKPGRSNIWACLPATGAKSCTESFRESGHARPIILLSHEDVVTSVPARWKAPPFSAEVIDGAIYARGAQDMKSEGLAQIMTMVLLKREKVGLTRPVILLATADEEVDGIGTDWMIANKKDLLGNAEYLLTEGGDNIVENGKLSYIGVDVAEKSAFWLILTAREVPGHGSRPHPNSAPNQLVRALHNVVNWKTPLKVLPVAEEYLKVLATQQSSAERARQLANIRQSIQDPKFRDSVANDLLVNYQLRNTISLTRLKGSDQTNVIPGEAVAHLDVRLLPGEDPGEFLDELKATIDNPDILVQPEAKEFRKGNSSAIVTPLFARIREVSGKYFPGTPVTPRMPSGYNETQRYRPLGITAYGYSPYTATAEEDATQHGDNERIRVEEVRRGFRVLYDVVTGVSTK